MAYIGIYDICNNSILKSEKKALDLHTGDELIIRIENGELRLFRQSQALQRIRAAVKRKITKKINPVDEFLAERKRDSE